MLLIQKELSGRERIGLLNLTPSATNGILKCTFQDVFGSKQSKEVLIKVLGKSETYIHIYVIYKYIKYIYSLETTFNYFFLP